MPFAQPGDAGVLQSMYASTAPARAPVVCGHLGGPQMESPLHRHHLLALLPEADRLALAIQADILALKSYDELSRADGSSEHVYFLLAMMALILIEAGNRTGGSGRSGDLHPHSAVPRPEAWRAACDGGSRPRDPQAGRAD